MIACLSESKLVPSSVHPLLRAQEGAKLRQSAENDYRISILSVTPMPNGEGAAHLDINRSTKELVYQFLESVGCEVVQVQPSDVTVLCGSGPVEVQFKSDLALGKFPELSLVSLGSLFDTLRACQWRSMKGMPLTADETYVREHTTPQEQEQAAVDALRKAGIEVPPDYLAHDQAERDKLAAARDAEERQFYEPYAREAPPDTERRFNFATQTWNRPLNPGESDF
jgi:hypothetical protein